MGADQAEAYGERNGVPGELLVRLHARTTVREVEQTALVPGVRCRTLHEARWARRAPGRVRRAHRLGTRVL